MNLRSRIVLASFFLVLVPLGIVGTVLDRNEDARERAEQTRQAERRFDAFQANWKQERATIEQKLTAIEESVRNDSEVRAAILTGQTGSTRLLDAAGPYARLAGFDILYLLDDTGIVLSSGHFRNEFGTKRARFAGAANRAFENGAVTEIGFADRRERAWIATHSFSLSGRNLVLAGGIMIGNTLFTRLRPDPDTRLTLAPKMKPDTPQPTPAFTRTFPVPFVGDDGTRAEHSFLVSWESGGFEAGRAAARRNLILTLGATGAGLLLLSFWFASRISAPLRSLATRASRFDLDRPDVSFRIGRNDEVGRLAGLLEEMKERIVRNADTIRSAERRAAIGDLARQVNHDLKNGLAPLRNIFRHLAGLSRDEPAALGAVWTERRGSAEQSLAYLEELATNYERLRPERTWRSCSLNETIRTVLAGVPGYGDRAGSGDAPDLPARSKPDIIRVQTSLDNAIPTIRANETDLRRIVENLIRNAWESMHERGGALTIETTRTTTGGDPFVLFRVRDEGPGMNEETAARVFEDFFTTKETGAGLGLTIVRRLITDHGGRIEFDSKPGDGTEFRVLFPMSAEKDI